MLIKNVVDIANQLDDMGLCKEATVFDNLMVKIAEQQGDKKKSISKWKIFYDSSFAVALFARVLKWLVSVVGLRTLGSLAVDTIALPATLTMEALSGLTGAIAGAASVPVAVAWFYMEVNMTIPQAVRIVEALLRGEDSTEIEPSTIVSAVLTGISKKLGKASAGFGKEDTSDALKEMYLKRIYQLITSNNNKKTFDQLMKDFDDAFESLGVYDFKDNNGSSMNKNLSHNLLVKRNIIKANEFASKDDVESLNKALVIINSMPDSDVQDVGYLTKFKEYIQKKLDLKNKG